MESIEKLRKYAANFGGPDWDEVGLIADAIEDEIDEKYVMRPTGLDGLLIYEGDVLETVYGERTEVTDVMATVWSYGVRISPSNHRHVTDNDPVKELLEELVAKVENDVNWRCNASDEIDCMTARIREAVEK